MDEVYVVGMVGSAQCRLVFGSSCRDDVGITAIYYKVCVRSLGG